MIAYLAKNIAHFYARKTIIENDATDVYAYGFELLISTIINIMAVLVIAVVMGVFAESILYLLAFVLLRSFGGGYHAKTHAGCIVSFAVTFFLFALALNHIVAKYSILYILVCAIVSSLIIWNLAPVEAVNKPLSQNKHIRLRKICFIIGCVFMGVAIFAPAIPVQFHSFLGFIYSGELAAAFSMIVAMIIKERRDII